MGFPCGSAGKESAYNAGDLGSILGLGRPLQYSGLEDSMDCIVRGVAKSQTQLNDFGFHFSLLRVLQRQAQRKQNILICLLPVPFTAGLVISKIQLGISVSFFP